MRPYRGYTVIQQFLSDSVSNYNAMQLFVARRKGRLKLTGSYTLSKTLTDAEGNNFNNEDALNRRLDYGIAGFSRPHIFIATSIYQLPALREANGFVRTLFGGYEISLVARYQSGQFFSPTFNDAFGTRRADYIGGDVNRPTDEQGNAVERNAERFFNTAAFAPAPLTRRGTAGRNIVAGPSLTVFDFSLRKNLALTERVRMQLRADLFHAFNKTNFNDVNENVNSAAFGQVTSTGKARNIQLSFRLNF